MNYLLAVLRADVLLILASINTTLFALSDAVAVALVSSICTTVLGIVTAYFAYKAKQHSERAYTESKETKQAVNGKMTEMVALAEKISHAEGVLQGEATATKVLSEQANKA